MTRLPINGVEINVEVRPGPPDAPALVLLHGFTGSAATWAGHMEALADLCTTIAIDALGHGESDAPADPARYGMAHVAGDTLAILDRLGVERFGLLGYSMGGRMALQVAVAAGPRLELLVLESASPGLRTAQERAARVAADEQLAALLEREGIVAFVDRWEQAPIFQSQRGLPPDVWQAQRAQRLSSNPHGLAASLRGAGTGAQPPLHDHLATLAAPTLLIVGEHDAKFRAIAREMRQALPGAGLAVVAGAGHAVHLEAPREFDSLVRQFIRRNTWHPSHGKA
jgi:2-succinyl-6-hydroxy-2,4-cyclohexadiene-1-carboxylate synthase